MTLRSACRWLKKRIVLHLVNRTLVGTHWWGANRPVEVGSGTWICGRSTILGGVRIGKGCVVAACVCVCRDVPDNTLVGGVPAKTIRDLETSV